MPTLIDRLSEVFEGGYLGHKNQFNPILNWQSTDPRTGFLPLKTNQTGSIPSGVTTGAMASTNTIYSQIIEMSRMDIIAAELNWTGTPTGTITILTSVSGINWPSLTFNPVFTQPTGSAGFEMLNISFLRVKYIMFQYVNSSGSGSLTGYLQFGDVN